MRAYLTTIWKLVTLMFAIVSCLLAHGTPALAITSYSAFADGSFSSCFTPGGCGPIDILGGAFLPVMPAGTDLIVTIGAGSSLGPAPILIGNASVSRSAGTAPNSPPASKSAGIAYAQTFGSASSPPPSFAASFLSAVLPALLLNLTDTTAAFPLLFLGSTYPNTTLGQNRLASAGAHASSSLVLDGNELVTIIDGQVTTFVPSTTGLFPGILLLTIPLPPGFHSLRLEVQAEGFASETAPEPTTLLLFGTTAAGLGLARWYRRRGHERAHAA